VNEVNAPLIAKERGIKFRESKTTEAADFSSLITLRATANNTTHTVAGTLFGKREPRLVTINEYSVEAVPEGNILLVENNDKPGVIGSLGNTMGARGINIGNMHVGRVKVGGKALCILHLDDFLSAEVLDTVARLPNVDSVKFIQL
jgi:D-3-phosphoglycerate dehydrogenase